MALSEFETKRAEKLASEFLKRVRPPASIRQELDIGIRVEGQSVEVFEIRPMWNDPTQINEIPVAKTTYVKSQRFWKISWMRADQKWHSYQPLPTVTTLEEFLVAVEKDDHCCFWG